jgi:hypothetical protein
MVSPAQHILPCLLVLLALGRAAAMTTAALPTSGRLRVASVSCGSARGPALLSRPWRPAGSRHCLIVRGAVRYQRYRLVGRAVRGTAASLLWYACVLR